ncbi:hypothetical protein INR49_017418 [Caranx melampygus]|nr:hypothetical protein INR49_017418 [Caranx melampygus]
MSLQSVDRIGHPWYKTNYTTSHFLLQPLLSPWFSHMMTVQMQNIYHVYFQTPFPMRKHQALSTAGSDNNNFPWGVETQLVGGGWSNGALTKCCQGKQVLVEHGLQKIAYRQKNGDITAT